MKQYPRYLYKSKEETVKVNNAIEEYEAGLEGFQSHWMERVNEAQKGTEKEVIRTNPEVFEDVEETIQDSPRADSPVLGETKSEESPEIREEAKPLSPQQRAAITRKKNKRGK